MRTFTLKEESEEDARWVDLLRSWTARINIVNMVVLPEETQCLCNLNGNFSATLHRNTRGKNHKIYMKKIKHSEDLKQS